MISLAGTARATFLTTEKKKRGDRDCDRPFF
jgi:hypothetical protein